MSEIWKDIEAYEGLYQVSNLGRVRSLDRKMVRSNGRPCTRKGQILRTNKVWSGYLLVRLCNGGVEQDYTVHRLVAKAFIPNRENKPQVNHIDGNKQNNQVNNLEWCTNGENVKHALRTGLIREQKGDNASHRTLTSDEVRYIRENHIKYDKEYGATALGKRFGVATSCIIAIVKRKTWKEIL